MAAYVIASFLDYLMTSSLLDRPMDAAGFQFVEVNSIAAYFVSLGGTAGLGAFKMAMVVLVAFVCRAIAREHIITARRVLEFGTVAVSSVAIYSAGLALRFG